MPLSDATIPTLKPRDKGYKAADFEGSFLTVKPTGSRLWHFKYRIAGKEKLLSLGIYPGISLAQARAAGDAARTLLAASQDPGEARQDRKREDQERQGHTFEKMGRSEGVTREVCDHVPYDQRFRPVSNAHRIG